MATPAQTHARSHALLLLQKLLNLRDGASPLTLVLDSLEQSGRPVVREFMARAKVSKSKIIFVSFATIKPPRGLDADADVFVRARGKTPDSLLAEITSHYRSTTTTGGSSQKILIILDALNPLLSNSHQHLHIPTFLSALVTGPSVSLVATYHTDIPLITPSSSVYGSNRSGSGNEYAPHPLATLTHLATAVLRTASLRRELDRRAADARSLPDPGWGISEGREGVVLGFRCARSGKHDGGEGERTRGLILEMELRRRSGRAVSERFVLVPSSSSSSPPAGITPTPASASALRKPSRIFLLAEHPLFRPSTPTNSEGQGGAGAGEGGEEEQPTSTFDLGLTDKQRQDRAGVVLPYFDAQTDVGSAGEGGRILYEMGREDDFDDEEDEI